jgi:large subunit ribosomal protein L17
MRHGKKFNHLGRQKGHREAMLSNMANSLILHKKINTTLAKAKALRVFIEPLITKAKNDSTHSRRVVFSYLQSKDSIKELFGDIATKVAIRPGGYTRILKTVSRLGDGADMCLIELVDYNEAMLVTPTKKKSRRTRKAKPTTAEETTSVVEDAKVESVEEEIKAPEVKADTTDKTDDSEKKLI